MTDPFALKLERLRNGERPRVLDLFSGCGGLSLGFLAAGFTISAAIEIDTEAAASHALNFCRELSDAGRAAHATPRDITKEEPHQLVADLGLGHEAMAFDVIVGGPPCQAYARVGRAKLREVAEHPEAFLRDPRKDLYLRYVHYVKQLKPLAILMENVPDLLNHGGHNIAEEISEVLEDLGYVAAYTLLNAANYGVPQMRERAFLLAYRREANVAVAFPDPTHWVDFPSGYLGTRSVALKTVTLDLFRREFRYVPPPVVAKTLPGPVTARAALGDLPKITDHLEGRLRRGMRKFDKIVPYPRRSELNEYAKLMRGWEGFESHDGVADHVIRSLPRDYKIFAVMNHGDQYPEAHQHALALLDKELRRAAKRGHPIKPGTAEYRRLKKDIVPPYDPSKFPNRWRKMERDDPARTLMAHIGKDSYTHIHYDSTQARTISVREAARLQSFPDGFKFVGAMNSSFRQIGNAVPPLHARAIATEMLKALRKAAGT
jgi:DNA (cytosine-5)-methyltransferase 1